MDRYLQSYNAGKISVEAFREGGYNIHFLGNFPRGATRKMVRTSISVYVNQIAVDTKNYVVRKTYSGV